jgi:hypothetical protein
VPFLPQLHQRSLQRQNIKSKINDPPSTNPIMTTAVVEMPSEWDVATGAAVAVVVWVGAVVWSFSLPSVIVVV